MIADLFVVHTQRFRGNIQNSCGHVSPLDEAAQLEELIGVTSAHVPGEEPRDLLAALYDLLEHLETYPHVGLPAELALHEQVQIVHRLEPFTWH